MKQLTGIADDVWDEPHDQLKCQGASDESVDERLLAEARRCVGEYETADCDTSLFHICVSDL